MDNQEYKIQNVAIEKIYKSDKNQQGQPYVSSKGNAFTKVDIYIDPRVISDTDFDGKMTYFDYFGNSDNWDIGIPLSGIITKALVGGRTYFNYNPPATGKKAVELDIKQLSERVSELEKQVIQIMKVKGLSNDVDQALDMSKEMLEDEDEIDESDLPF
jgi:hypothetical protein